MRKKVKEIEKVFESHRFSIDSIIQKAMKKFNFRSLVHEAGFKKEHGFSITDILSLMLLFPLMLINSVNALYQISFDNMKKMKKDAFYRVKNNEHLPWCSLLYLVSKQFQKLVNPKKEIKPNAAFIFDDTIDSRTGKRIEKMSWVNDHVGGRGKRSKLGFKKLTMGLFDGTSFIPLDCSLHSEKPLKRKDKKKQYKKERNPKSNGAKRKKECEMDKITSALRMLKRAVKHGFRAKYVLVDSWFPSKGIISTVRGIKDGAMHVICAVKRDFRKYSYNGEELNAKELFKVLKKEKKEKRCRKKNVRYFEVVVYYPGIEETVKLYFCRYPYQKDWKLYLSTDKSLSLLETLEVYAVRWSIEVFFKESKQLLRLGKCQSQDFDAQIAHVTMTYILYVFLSYFRRINDYETLGGLFADMRDEMAQKNIAEQLWEMFDELLDVVITTISESGPIDIQFFKKSPEYKYLEDLFESSFLENQLFGGDNAA